MLAEVKYIFGEKSGDVPSSKFQNLKTQPYVENVFFIVYNRDQLFL